VRRGGYVRVVVPPKRGYSKAFRPHGDTGKKYTLDAIPAGLWREVQEKSKREGISIRALLLTYLKGWVQS
jgi:hypothetical protein